MKQGKDWSVEKDIGVSQEALCFIFALFLMQKTLFDHTHFFLVLAVLQTGVNGRILSTLIVKEAHPFRKTAFAPVSTKSVNRTCFQAQYMIPI